MSDLNEGPDRTFHGRGHPARHPRPHRRDQHPARGDQDAGVCAGRYQGHRQNGCARGCPRSRCAGGAGQRLSPVPAAGPGHRRRGRWSGEVHELARTDLHRQRWLSGHVARGRLQEGHRDGPDRHAERRRHRRGQRTTGPCRRRRCDVQVPSGRVDAPVHARRSRCRSSISSAPTSSSGSTN